MSTNTTPAVPDVLIDIRTLLTGILPANVPVVTGIANRVPAPNPAPGYVVMTPIYQARLEWPIDTIPTGPEPTTANVQNSTQIDVQVDFYGQYAGTWAAQFVTLWRDEYACSVMKNSQPLYADEARMMPLVDSEQQYEERWSVTASAQYNPVTTISQGYADALDITLIDVQEKYPA